MEAFPGSSHCSGSRSPSRSFSGIDNAHSRPFSRRRSHTTRLHRLYVNPLALNPGLLILMLILCLAPISTLAQPAQTISVLDADISRLASDPSGELFFDDLHAGSLLRLLENLQSRSDDGMGIQTKHNHGLLLQRRTSSSSSDTSTEMPTPFDTISINFANATCVSFFQNFLSNSTVMNCHAVSLLLENSNSFFHTLTSTAATSRVLDVACSEPVSKCASIMNSLADAMLQDDNCGPDYGSNNSVVQGTYQDLLAYEPMYRATCLTNPDTQNYCFVDAVTNTTAPDDYNVYFMPLGSTLSPGRLTCNECLQATMDVFAHWARVDGQSLDETYLPSAKKVNKICGAGFANTNVTVGSDTVTSGAGLTVPLPDIRIAASMFGLVLGAILTWSF